ncbi:MAG: hypothetical protein ACM3JB_22870 [Acidobacteriaceae bacterium]
MRSILVLLLATVISSISVTQLKPQTTDVHTLYLQDQEDRGIGGKAVSNWQDRVKRDAERRDRVRELIKRGALKTGEDFHDAAFVFQHSVQTDEYPADAVANDFLLAHVLANVAIAKGDSKSLWISAASLDRYLQLTGRPQVFGTQYQSKDNGPVTQDPYDSALIPDALRAVFCVPPIKQQELNVAEFDAGKYPKGILPPGCSR